MKNLLSYGGLDISVINSTDTLVPQSSHKVDIPSGMKKTLAIAVNNDMPVLLVGETGTGKTSIVRDIAYKRKQPYIRVNMTGFTTPDELIGSKSVKDGETYYEHGIITDAMQRGAILVLDEINSTSPDCLFILHGLLDEDKRISLPNGEVVTPHEHFRVFATCNPDYEGTKSMNKAFLDRFPVILTVDALSANAEIKLLMDRTGIDEDTATMLVVVATKAREEYSNHRITVYVSTRSLLQIATLIKHGLDVKEAYSIAVVKKTANKQEQQIMSDIYLSSTKIAENMSPEDKTVITTLSEINGYKKQIDEMTSLANERLTKLTEKTSEVTGLKNALDRANGDIIVLRGESIQQKELIEKQKQELQAFKKLEQLITKVSKEKSLSDTKNTP